ncbi:glucosamine-fructose-6-phosphate aminotransferase, partial [Rhizobium johnstonii]
REKGAVVIGVGGPGDLELAVDVYLSLAGLVVLPALQVLGERASQARQIDTVSPRHLTKVVTLS